MALLFLGNIGFVDIFDMVGVLKRLFLKLGSIIFTHRRDIYPFTMKRALTVRRVHRNLFKSIFIVCNVHIILRNFEMSTEPLLSPLVVSFCSLLVDCSLVLSDLIQSDRAMKLRNLLKFLPLKLCNLLITLLLCKLHLVVKSSFHWLLN